MRRAARGFERRDRLLLARRGDGDKAAAHAQPDHAGQGAYRGFVQGLEPGALRRRPQHAAVHHARQLHVVHEGGAAEFGADVAPCHAFSHDRVLCAGLGRRAAGGRAREAHLAGEVPVAGRKIGSRQLDRAVVHAQFGGAHLEAARGFFDEQLAHLGAGEPHRGAADLDRLAAGGVPLVGRAARVAGHDREPRQRNIQLFGGDLRDGGDDALAEFDLAAEHGDRAVGVEAHPAVEPRIGLEALRQDRGAHRAAPAARLIARRMRTCVPQRHRLRSRACAISASVGAGFSREQRLGRHDDAVDAVAALHRLLVDERLLQPAGRSGRAQALDGGDLVSRGRPQRRVAGLHRVAVDQHGAGAAVALAAAEARALQLEVVAQDVDERRVRIRAHRVLATVHAQGEIFCHAGPPSLMRAACAAPASRSSCP